MKGGEWWLILIAISIIAEIAGSIRKAAKKARETGPERRPPHSHLPSESPAAPAGTPPQEAALEEWLRRLERGEPVESPPPRRKVFQEMPPEPAAMERPMAVPTIRDEVAAAPKRGHGRRTRPDRTEEPSSEPVPAELPGPPRRQAGQARATHPVAIEIRERLRRRDVAALVIAAEILGPPRAERDILSLS